MYTALIGTSQQLIRGRWGLPTSIFGELMPRQAPLRGGTEVLDRDSYSISPCNGQSECLYLSEAPLCLRIKAPVSRHDHDYVVCSFAEDAQGDVLPHISWYYYWANISHVNRKYQEATIALARPPKRATWGGSGDPALRPCVDRQAKLHCRYN